jgi:hypothetical protein
MGRAGARLARSNAPFARYPLTPSPRGWRSTPTMRLTVALGASLAGLAAADYLLTVMYNSIDCTGPDFTTQAGGLGEQQHDYAAWCDG